MTATLESESKLLSAARDALSLEPMERDVLGPMQAEIVDLREVSSPLYGRSSATFGDHRVRQGGTTMPILLYVLGSYL